MKNVLYHGKVIRTTDENARLLVLAGGKYLARKDNHGKPIKIDAIEFAPLWKAKEKL